MGDMPSHSLNRRRASGLLDLGSDMSLILAKAIADHACPRRLLLPDGDANIGTGERVVRAVEVNNLARGSGAKAILSRFEALKRDLSKKSLYR